MKRFLLAVAVLCIGTAAFAFENAGGTLVVSDMNLTVAATTSAPICGQGAVLASCSSAITRIYGTDTGDANTKLFKVYAAFLSASSPRVMGVAWGVTSTPNVSIAKWWNCGDFELPDADWPADRTGNSVTFDVVRTSHLIPVYVFAAYGDGTPGTFGTAPNPDPLIGGVFGNDNVPADLDPIAGFSVMGFDGPGVLACAYCCGPPGACCNPLTGGCTYVSQADCTFNWSVGDCEPNPCPLPVPVDHKSWGRIKDLYH
jgi:hypothetical protein